jgi:hypothetical protein
MDTTTPTPPTLLFIKVLDNSSKPSTANITKQNKYKKIRTK